MFLFIKKYIWFSYSGTTEIKKPWFFEVHVCDVCTCVLNKRTWRDLLLEPLFDLDSIGGLLFVAPLPASRLFSNDGLLAHINAWNDDTVKTPSLFKVFLVVLDTCVSRDCNEEYTVLLINAEYITSFSNAGR